MVAIATSNQRMLRDTFGGPGGPRQVVYSAGYRHHFGHPQAGVVARYLAVGARPWNTAVSGALRFTWNAAGEINVAAQRAHRRHYWE